MMPRRLEVQILILQCKKKENTPSGLHSGSTGFHNEVVWTDPKY